MTDELKLQRQRARGGEAKRLWENSMLQEAFTKIDNAVKEAFFSSKAEDTDLRERCYLMLRLHENYKQELKSIMFTGEIATKQLLDIEEQRKRAKA